MTNFSTSLSLSGGKGTCETIRCSVEKPNTLRPQKKSDQLKQIMEEKNRDDNEALEIRIKQREKEEARKERELILNGKIRPTKDQVKSDKILQIYERVRILNQKAKLESDSKPKLKTASKWQKTARKITTTNKTPSASFSFKTLPMFPVQTDCEELNFRSNAGIGGERKIFVKENPIHKSFAEAKSVDDLYEIAEFWLSRPNIETETLS